MKLSRRRSLHLALGAAAIPTVSRISWAQSYPARPVHWIVCFSPGGPNDIVARVIGQYLSDHLGQQFIIENRVGAGGNVGMQSALSATPDGYTIVFVGPNNAINATLYERLAFDFIRDSVPVAGTMRLTNVMEVNLAVPANSVAEFIAYAKANPGKINFASGGVGTSPHLSGELFKAMTGVNIVHVPYRGIDRASFAWRLLSFNHLVGAQQNCLLGCSCALAFFDLDLLLLLRDLRWLW